jgi:hypothetical protein
MPKTEKGVGKGRRRVTCKSRGHDWSQVYRPVMDCFTFKMTGLEFRYCQRCRTVKWEVEEDPAA